MNAPALKVRKIADVGASGFAKVIRRNATAYLVESPEGKLMLAVITQAFADGDGLRPQDQNSGSSDARNFFFDGRMDRYATAIGLNPVSSASS